MDSTYKEMCEFFNPKMNDAVMNGYVLHELKGKSARNSGNHLFTMEERINSTLHKAYHGLFDGKLIYEGMERCSPQEAFEFATRTKNGKRTFELAPSDIYLVRIKLHWKVNETNIQPLPDVFLYLPDPGQGGTMHLGRPLYQLIPIVSDKVISPENDYLFVRLEQNKMKFKREKNYMVKVDGNPLPSDVYYADIYKQKAGKKKSLVTKAVSCLVHYMLARMGFSELFRKYTGIVPVLGDQRKINSVNYNPDAWVIISSAYETIKPPTIYGNYFKPNQICMAVPKEKWNDAMKSLVYGFYYVTDAFTEFFDVEHLDKTDNWKITLGNIISDPNYSAGKLLGVVEEHFASTDTYLDELSIEKLAEKGLYVENFTELLGLITTRFTELYYATPQSQSVYGKYLDTMREMLYPITYSIYNIKYQLMKLASSKSNNPPFKSVSDIFVRKFKPGPIFKLTNKGIVAEVVSYSGDHMYFKITSRLSQQESTPGTRTSKGRKGNKTNMFINTSMIRAGSVLFLSKNNPIPMSHVNPFILLDLETGTILEDPKFKEELDRVDQMLLLK